MLLITVLLITVEVRARFGRDLFDEESRKLDTLVATSASFDLALCQFVVESHSDRYSQSLQRELLSYGWKPICVARVYRDRCSKQNSNGFILGIYRHHVEWNLAGFGNRRFRSLSNVWLVDGGTGSHRPYVVRRQLLFCHAIVL